MVTNHSREYSDERPGSSGSSAAQETMSPGDAIRLKWRSKFVSGRIWAEPVPRVEGADAVRQPQSSGPSGTNS
jgi:hypothetical protein